MNNFYFFLFLFFGISAISQNKANKIIVDKTTKAPLEYVTIYNDTDNSISNSDGLFVFVSNKKEINFSLIGYSTLSTTFEDLKNKDSIFMESKALLLDEVIVNNAESIIKKAYNNSKKNYLLAPLTENFFLRCLLKKDDEIVRLQDVFGKTYRLTQFQTPEIKENKLAVEILNMRKTGFLVKNDITYLAFPGFDILNFLSSIFLSDVKLYDFTEIKSGDDSYRRINFIKKEKDKNGQTLSGSYIIKRDDYAIVQFSLNLYDDNDVNPYLEKKGHKYRTTKFKFTTNFTKNTKIDKYYMSNSSVEFRLEILADSKIEKTLNYDFVADYFVTNSFTNEEVNANFSITKDIFKAKFPYSENFWKTQNQLPISNELKTFLTKVSENKDKKKEFEVIGNF